MDNDRLKGAARRKAGQLKEAAGKALGDEKLKREGLGDKARGTAQNAVGSAKDAVRQRERDKE